MVKISKKLIGGILVVINYFLDKKPEIKKKQNDYSLWASKSDIDFPNCRYYLRRRF